MPQLKVISNELLRNYSDESVFLCRTHCCCPSDTPENLGTAASCSRCHSLPPRSVYCDHIPQWLTLQTTSSPLYGQQGCPTAVWRTAVGGANRRAGR